MTAGHGVADSLIRHGTMRRETKLIKDDQTTMQPFLDRKKKKEKKRRMKERKKEAKKKIYVYIYNKSGRSNRRESMRSTDYRNGIIE